MLIEALRSKKPDPEEAGFTPPSMIHA